MKGNKYAKTLAKIQVSAILRIWDIWRNVFPKFIGLCMETPRCNPSNMAAQNQQKHLSMSSTSTVWIIQVRDKLVSPGSYRHLSNTSSNKRTVQTAKFPKMRHFLNLHDRSLGHYVNAASCESLEIQAQSFCYLGVPFYVPDTKKIHGKGPVGKDWPIDLEMFS